MDKILQMNKPQLQAALASALKETEALQWSVKATKDMTAIEMTPSAPQNNNTGDFSDKMEITEAQHKSTEKSYLEKLPPELRGEIFKYLLVNPILSSIHVLSKWARTTRLPLIHMIYIHKS